MQRSIDRAIDRNNTAFFESLPLYKINLTTQQASDLLQRVVHESKNVQFVPILVQKFGADVNYSFDKKRTVLIEAVEENNGEMVRALLEAGADPSLVLDTKVGSAQQIAFERGYVAIEPLLRGVLGSGKPAIPSNTRAVIEK